jgi:hypothetical protein
MFASVKAERKFARMPKSRKKHFAKKNFKKSTKEILQNLT